MAVCKRFLAPISNFKFPVSFFVGAQRHLNSKPVTFNTKHASRSAQPETRYSILATRNPQPATRNQPQVMLLRAFSGRLRFDFGVVFYPGTNPGGP